jgi:hypothetical protein
MAASSSSACTKAPPRSARRGASPLEEIRRRRDRVARAEAEPTPQGAETGELVAGGEGAAPGGHGRAGRLVRERRPGPDAGSGRLDDGRALALELLVERGEERVEGEAHLRGEEAEGDAVGAAALDVLGGRGEGELDDPGTPPRERLRHRAGAVARHQEGGSVHGHVGHEALGLGEVEGEDEIEAIVVAAEGPVAEAEQGGGLPAADLWTDGAGHQAVAPGPGGGVEEHRPGRDGAVPAAPEDGDGKALVGGHRG